MYLKTYTSGSQPHQLDYPLPNESNVIMLDEMLDNHYIKLFKCPKWSTAVVFESGKYFLFNHDSVGISSSRHQTSYQSWYVYRLEFDQVSDIINNGYKYWKVIFESVSRFGEFYYYRERDGQVQSQKFPCPITSDVLMFPDGKHPADFDFNRDIFEFANSCLSRRLDISKSYIRDLLISEIL